MAAPRRSGTTLAFAGSASYAHATPVAAVSVLVGRDGEGLAGPEAAAAASLGRDGVVWRWGVRRGGAAADAGLVAKGGPMGNGGAEGVSVVRGRRPARRAHARGVGGAVADEVDVVWREKRSPYVSFATRSVDMMDHVTALGVSCSGRWAATASWNGGVAVWDLLASLDAEHAQQGFRGPSPVCVIEWHDTNDDALLAGAWDGSTRVWDTRNGGRSVRILRAAEPDAVSALALTTHNGRELALVAHQYASVVRLWDAFTGEALARVTLVHPALTVGFLRGALAGDGGALLLVTCGPDAVRLWTEEGREALEPLDFASAGHGNFGDDARGEGVTAAAYQRGVIVTGHESGVVAAWMLVTTVHDNT